MKKSHSTQRYYIALASIQMQAGSPEFSITKIAKSAGVSNTIGAVLKQKSLLEGKGSNAKWIGPDVTEDLAREIADATIQHVRDTVEKKKKESSNVVHLPNKVELVEIGDALKSIVKLCQMTLERCDSLESLLKENQQKALPLNFKKEG